MIPTLLGPLDGTHFCPQSGEAEHFFNKNGTEESVHHISLIFFVSQAEMF
jgi:hypothetical protein